MGDPDVDRQQAAAEAGLDRVDDRDEDERTYPDPAEVAAELGDGMHIEDRDLVRRDEHGRVMPPEDEPDDDGLPARSGTEAELADCLDAMAEAFNARDLDGLLALVADDCETPGLASDLDDFADAIDDLWERRPSCLLTRGELEGEPPVGVLWELGEADVWWPLASVHVADPVDGQVGVVEFADDPTLLDRVQATPPDGDLEEGSRWIEWQEGAQP